MIGFKITRVLLIGAVCSPLFVFGDLKVDDSPAKPGFWGFRPADEEVIQVTPPGFSWRPQSKADEYEVQVARSSDFSVITYGADGITMSVHCPPQVLERGKWFWRFRFKADGKWSAWSKTRSFSIAEDARAMPLPERQELLGRIPASHPRLFVRPEQMDELRSRAQGDLTDLYKERLRKADNLLKKLPSTDEPPKYGREIVKNSDEWRTIWWGNRRLVQRTLGAAAELGFVWQLSKEDKYGQAARRILMECAKWDPKGSTGFRYNDEAGMPYNYFFSRTYTFINELLSESERQKCREVMKVRGDEMYSRLYPRHIWRPYGSHSNRAWHFLGEIGIAFYDEIPAAEEWVWFAANVFANLYPVWNDSDGGWHEGMAYWASYISRFTWWADIMKAAFGVDAFDKPYFSQCGYFPMYAVPPGTKSGGFGDCTTAFKSKNCARLVSVLAAQAANPYWSWFAQEHGVKDFGGGYIGFLRSSLPKIEAKKPDNLPQSIVFRGVGQAYLNTDLTSAANNIQIHFKSSPFGTVSHGYNSQNSFLLYVGGERLFLRSGRRDSYGTAHHKNWMWHTKSDNCITVNGESQLRHSPYGAGRIVEFKTDSDFDYLVGDASQAYAAHIKRFTRRILFVKPEVVVIWDSLEAPEPSTFEWRLHTGNAMKINGQHDILATNRMGGCKVDFLYPADLRISQTDKFDPPPRPRVKLLEHHLTAATSEPDATQDFVTVLRPSLKGQRTEGKCGLELTASVYRLWVPLRNGGQAMIYLNSKPKSPLEINGKQYTTEAAAVILDANNQLVREWSAKMN
jgi:hypothetical protein